MARKKQTGTEIKLYQIDTMIYLTTKNVITKLTMFAEFLKEGGVAKADQLNINRARALERFDRNYKITDINELTSVDGQANETWLRKNGFLYSVGGRYELSPIASAIIRNKISLAEYCFLLLSKQWIRIKKVGGQDEYKVNLLAFILGDLLENKSIPVNDFVDHIGQIALEKYKDEYSELQLSNQEAARYLIDPLLISRLITESNGNYVISSSIVELAIDYVSKANGIKRLNQVPCADEEYWNNFQYGIYDITNEENKSLYIKHYPHLFTMKELSTEKWDLPLQKIYYGAPGTGKSNEIKILTGEGKDGIVFSKDYTFRTTFHPDFDYSTFVGAYKPIWDEGKGKIVYEFRPQTFLKAYVAAWTHPSENVALVIEEINRGNCAQIFGDIFQLLDRENDGFSKYPIESDIDMKGFLSSALSGKITELWAGTIPEDDKDSINAYYSKHYDNAFDRIKLGEILTLPKNLSILASMNTSDQSLFPMDSAFKRRWEWQYMPIVNANKNWKIQLDKDYENIDWWEFLQRINNVISDLTTSEDKQLGYFFCQPDDFVSPEHAPDAEPDLISAKRFVDKVIFYLWNDVFKDYAFDAKCCKDKDGKEVLFAKFYNEDGKSVNIEILKHFFELLTVDNKPSLVKEIVPTSDASGEEDANVTDATSVNEEPSSTGNESEESESSTTATTDE